MLAGVEGILISHEQELRNRSHLWQPLSIYWTDQALPSFWFFAGKLLNRSLKIMGFVQLQTGEAFLKTHQHFSDKNKLSFVLQNWTERLKEAVSLFLSHLHYLANLSFSLLLSKLDQPSQGAKGAAGVLYFVLACRVRPWLPDVIQSKLKTMRVFPLTSGSTRSSSKFLRLMKIVIYWDLILQVAKDHKFSFGSIEMRLSAYVESSLVLGYFFSCSSGNRSCAPEAEIDIDLRCYHCFLCSCEGKGKREINLYQWSQESDKHKSLAEFFLLIGKLDTT